MMLATAATGLTLYAVLLDAAGEAWNGSAFETPSAANWSDYALAMAEADTTGVYRGDMPGVAAGVYSFLVYRQVGGAAAVGDPCIGAGSIRWTGTAEEGVPDVDLSEVLADLAAIRLVTDALDVSQVVYAPASNAGHLRITGGLTFEAAVSGLVIPSDWAAAIWTVKYSAAQPDSAAVLQVWVSNPGLGTDGLQRLNGGTVEAPLAASDGGLTVDQAGGWVDLYLGDEVTAQLLPYVGLGWDIKVLDAQGESVGWRGTADIGLTETRATA